MTHSMTPPWRKVAVLAVLGASLGCSTIDTIKLASPEPTPTEGSWAEARNAVTRREFIYDQVVHRATVTATYLSPSVREARARRLQEWLGWTPEELTRRLESEAAEAAKYDDFVVSLFTYESKANDLDAPESIWRLALVLDDGKEVVTHDAKALDVNATLSNLFPAIGKFDTVYRVRFNRVAGAPLQERKFTFVVASALGMMQLRFGDGTVGPDRPQGTPIP